MRVLKVLLLIAALLPLAAYSQEQKRIEEIRLLFSEWQPIIKTEINNAPSVYRYAWGDRYENEEWTIREIKSDQKRLSEKYSVISKKIGHFVLYEIYSFSGDWFIVSENYYDKNGNLFFVFWKMNTFHAEEPATIEKRLYLDETGNIIRRLRNVYKMNTKQKLDVSFMDRDVDYELTFKDMAFHKYLPERL